MLKTIVFLSLLLSRVAFSKDLACTEVDGSIFGWDSVTKTWTSTGSGQAIKQPLIIKFKNIGLNSASKQKPVAIYTNNESKDLMLLNPFSLSPTYAHTTPGDVAVTLTFFKAGSGPSYETVVMNKTYGFGSPVSATTLFQCK